MRSEYLPRDLPYRYRLISSKCQLHRLHRPPRLSVATPRAPGRRPAEISSFETAPVYKASTENGQQSEKCPHASPSRRLLRTGFYLITGLTVSSTRGPDRWAVFDHNSMWSAQFNSGPGRDRGKAETIKP
ncbi:hypothetical protein GWI33_010226 [Rhynchophorus ferrugineus]|uniref:Uncharacterized protein n=1 Tax=Rhynchophorus ferrugineus TaxID=354439 RepID=A0A834M8A0_RHYFE|nr:hypothetical protein GWI33_011595 [Rhynchophorus ferrugineus]KAF7276496.1 hypothetical protein GWI33_010226 [Rhynchophorus ferrugineus]